MTKRHPMQISEDVMTIFKQCHKNIKAKSIGRSVTKTILNLRAKIGRLETKVQTVVARNKELELEVETLAKATSVEALEERPEAPTPTEVGESSIKVKEVETPPHHKCTFRTMDLINPKNEWVLCSKDYDHKGIMHRVIDDVCRQCWDRIMSKRQGTHEKEKKVDNNIR